MPRRLATTAHVFVFAAFPFLSIYASSLATFPLGVDIILRGVAAACLISVVMLVAMRVWTPDLQQRSAALSFFLIGTQSFVFSATLGDGYWLRTGKPAWALVAIHVAGGLLLASRARDQARARRRA